MRRLQFRWEKDGEKWRYATERIQIMHRGIVDRKSASNLRITKGVMLATCKSIVKASELLAKGKFEECVSEISAAIVKDPSSKMACLVRGRAYVCLLSPSQAINDFTTAAMKDSNPETQKKETLRMRVILGDIYHEPMVSFERFNKMIIATLCDSFNSPKVPAALEMLRVSAYANRGRVMCGLKNWDLAIQDFTEVIESQGDTGDLPSLYLMRGCAYCKTQNWGAAVDDFSLNVQLSPMDVDALVRRSAAYSAQQNWDAAYSDMSKVMEIQKTKPQPEIYVMRGRLLTCMRKWEDAETDLRHALAIDRDCEAAQYVLAQATIKHVSLPLLSQHDE
jgi:tetratricopeptide (TPR) repeat protein